MCAVDLISSQISTSWQICVWCWHHIMDMAEKDDTEGRCPACRSAYDKERIVGMAANCERLLAPIHLILINDIAIFNCHCLIYMVFSLSRLVAEISLERKIKSQKAKAKPSEGRKQLSSVRVIQRNLVYIVGLPLNLADEDVLYLSILLACICKLTAILLS